jgi:hypothetical protein
MSKFEKLLTSRQQMMCVTFLQFLEMPLFVKLARSSKKCLKFVDCNRDYDFKKGSTNDDKLPRSNRYLIIILGIQKLSQELVTE